MKIKKDFNGKKGSFFIENGGKKIAEITFVMAGSNKMIIDHTEVGDKLRGQGVGRKLLNELITYVRDEQIKVLPLCPYAKSQFDKDPSIRDVLN